MNAVPTVLAGCGAVSAVGRGLASIDEAVARNTRALAPCVGRDCGAAPGEVYGVIDESVWDAMRLEFPAHAPDRAFLLAAAAISDARADAASCLERVAPERVALILSTTKGHIEILDTAGESAGDPAGDSGQAADPPNCHVAHQRLAKNLAAEFGAAGEVQCVSVACTSGLIAIAQGARLIALGEADAAIVVGVDYLSRFLLEGFRCLQAIDPGGCRPFDADRAGMTAGEAGAAVVLAREDLAPEAATRVIGWGSSNDANHLTGPSRDGSGMALAIRRSLKVAGIAPDAIDLVNGHGTATPFNDAMEALAYRSVFGEGAGPAVCASKGMFGHTFGAGGVLETILCDRAARAGLRPGTPGLSNPDEGAPPGLLREPTAGGFRRTLKVNAGFAGVNGAIVLEHL